MTTSWKKYLGVLVPLAAVVAAPLLLRDTEVEGAAPSELRLEIITPHNELIRREFGEAFAKWYQEKEGKSVYVNWRSPGGTSEIKRVLDTVFTAAEERGKEGVGIDLFFGGGVYDFSKQAKLERFAPLPEKVFQYDILQTLSGETFYNSEKTWVGVCLSSFGICYNLDSLERRKLSPPRSWSDLGQPEYARGIALADPTKSGSVAKIFEMIVQEQMHQGGTREEGWVRGLNLIQRITANARYFTDASSKVPYDVAQGNSVAGMCIDFYGRNYNEGLKDEAGRSRLEFVTPIGGSSISVDPVAILRGAPHPEIAADFVSFLFTEQGQMLWNARPGAEFGPRQRALRRLPIRRDLYQEPYLSTMTDKEAMPYETADRFIYQRELTGHLFTPLRNIIRVMCIDSHEEMKAAWAALIKADFPAEALTVFYDVSPVNYELAGTEIRQTLKSGNKVDVVKMANRLGRHFRKNYQQVERMCR